MFTKTFNKKLNLWLKVQKVYFSGNRLSENLQLQKHSTCKHQYGCLLYVIEV